MPFCGFLRKSSARGDGEEREGSTVAPTRRRGGYGLVATLNMMKRKKQKQKHPLPDNPCAAERGLEKFTQLCAELSAKRDLVSGKPSSSVKLTLAKQEKDWVPFMVPSLKSPPPPRSPPTHTAAQQEEILIIPLSTTATALHEEEKGDAKPSDMEAFASPHAKSNPWLHRPMAAFLLAIGKGAGMTTMTMAFKLVHAISHIAPSTHVSSSGKVTPLPAPGLTSPPSLPSVPSPSPVAQASMPSSRAPPTMSPDHSPKHHSVLNLRCRKQRKKKKGESPPSAHQASPLPNQRLSMARPSFLQQEQQHKLVYHVAKQQGSIPGTIFATCGILMGLTGLLGGKILAAVVVVCWWYAIPYLMWIVT